MYTWWLLLGNVFAWQLYVKLFGFRRVWGLFRSFQMHCQKLYLMFWSTTERFKSCFWSLMFLPYLGGFCLRKSFQVLKLILTNMISESFFKDVFKWRSAWRVLFIENSLSTDKTLKNLQKSYNYPNISSASTNFSFSNLFQNVVSMASKIFFSNLEGSANLFV